MLYGQLTSLETLKSRLIAPQRLHIIYATQRTKRRLAACNAELARTAVFPLPEVIDCRYGPKAAIHGQPHIERSSRLAHHPRQPPAPSEGET